MTGTSSFKAWIDVPDRSVLVIEVKGEAGFTANASFMSLDNRILRLTDDQIHPGPGRPLLSQTAMGYGGHIQVLFVAASSIKATISAWIEAPDGTGFKSAKT